MNRRLTLHSTDSPAAGGAGAPSTSADDLAELFDRTCPPRPPVPHAWPDASDPVQGGEEQLIPLILHAARRGPKTLRRPWGIIVVEVFAPRAGRHGAIVLRVVPVALWHSARTSAAHCELAPEECVRWIRPTAWALARQFLPRGILLANLAIARWQPRAGELFALVVPDEPDAAGKCVEVERTFFDQHMPAIIASVHHEIEQMRTAVARAGLATQTA